MQRLSLSIPGLVSNSPVISPKKSEAKDFVSKPDVFTPRFQGNLTVKAPDTVEKSRFSNDRVQLSTHDVISDLVEKMDEVMTVTGEVYSGNEAFTTTLGVKLNNKNLPKRDAEAHRMDATISAQVENTMKAVMVLSSDAVDYKSKKTLATARASFSSVDPQSVIAGKFQTVPVTPLVQDPMTASISQEAAQWNAGMFKFYKDLATRLGARDPNVVLEDLSQAKSSSRRLINNNIYVTTHMLNKKQTGHGGITSAMALKDMAALADKYIPRASGAPAVQLSAFSANYLAPYVGTDALQFDTTVDDVDPDGNIFMSTRINKFDTKKRTVTGPVILVHAKMEPVASFVPKGDPLDPTTLDADGLQRMQEARDWAKLNA